MAKEISIFSEKDFLNLYRIIKYYEDIMPKSEEDAHIDFQDEEFVDGKIVSTILKKIRKNLSEKERDEIEKDFLRRKYHTFRDDIDGKIYAAIKKSFSKLATIEIEYFNMERATFTKRKVDVYYYNSKYVIGYCQLRRAVRKFRLSRISSARLVGNNYKIPVNFDKNDY